MIVQGLRCCVPVGTSWALKICRMSSVYAPCQIQGRVIFGTHGRRKVTVLKKDWFCPIVDVLSDLDGKQDTLVQGLKKLVKGKLSWSCLPPFAGGIESRHFTTQSITYGDLKAKWGVTAYGRGGSAMHNVSGVHGGTSTDAGVEMEVKHRAEFMRKKKVALWVGYVGTDYKGLQIVRGPDSVKTVEGELEKAIFKAGGILESNYGYLEKVGWSRSSRTDKGVHCLATTITMKMELPPTAWMSDIDGLQLAGNINIHLPPTIRVFGVVPVTKSFDARRFCCHRTYHYLLPAALIGIRENTALDVTGERIENFRRILSQFVGRYPYHNFTKRRLYRSSVLNAKSSWGKNNSRRRSPFPVKAEVDSKGDEVEEDTDEPEPPIDTVNDNANLLPDMLDVKAYWLSTPNKADKLGPSHFRRVLECTCGGLEVENGARFIRISVTGESFMVHQIRKMVATAVGVSRGFLPHDIITLALCRHTRVILPLAPSEGLLLARNSFYPYRQLLAPASERAFRESEVGVERLKELPKLHMSSRIEENADSFWRNVLLPKIIPLLDESLPHWTFWLSCLESQGFITEAEIVDVRIKWTNWREQGRLTLEQARAAGIPLSEIDEELLSEEGTQE